MFVAASKITIRFVGALPLPEDARETETEHDMQDDQGGRKHRLAPSPFDNALEHAGATSHNRFMALPVLEVIGQRRGRGVAARRVLLEALKSDGFKIAIDGRV
jgi:hypothetical protein